MTHLLTLIVVLPLLGAVLNGTDPQGPESPYYGYYRHYYEQDRAN